MIKNVLFSTTRQWNPGDEFILLGIINTMKQLPQFSKGFNPIIYNRNPDIQVNSRFKNPMKTKKITDKIDRINFRGRSLVEPFLRMGFYDNSFKPDTSPESINAIIFAGTPEWYGNRLEKLFEISKEYNIPVAFLGIGLGGEISIEKLPKACHEALKHSYCITTRDKYTQKLLSRYNARQLACPALLSSSIEKERKMVKKIGLIYSTYKSTAFNNISKETYRFILKFYKMLSLQYNVSLICHYIDEIEEAIKDFPGLEMFYSYDAKDYQEIYNKFDLVIGVRVHGIGLSASLGIPGIMIAHDYRSETVTGFKATVISADISKLKYALTVVENNVKNIEELSEKLIIYKNEVKQEYIDLLSGFCLE